MPITIETVVEGGKASAAPLGSALGPTGVNLSVVVTEINRATALFAGMQVPVKIKIEPDTKEFSIEVGTPPTTSLLLKEAGIEKGSSMPDKDKVASLAIEQIIKVAKMKEACLTGVGLKQKVKSVIGSCVSIGVLVENKEPKQVLKDIEAGLFDSEIAAEKTELSAEERSALEAEKARLAEEISRRHAAQEKLANEIITSMAGKEKSLIKSKLREMGIPETLIAKLLIGAAPAPAAASPPK
mgnify:CR=1 FL=1